LKPNTIAGAFDDCGVMPTSIVSTGNKKYLYYIGWTKKITIPYHNSIGLLILDGENKERLPGPVVSTSINDPGFQGTAFVLKEDNWKMWYLSSVGWTKNEPLYHIKLATSEDGISWSTSDKACIPLKQNEGGISSAAVVRSDNGSHMWYSYRGKFNFRTDKKFSYKIGYAISNDDINWNRKDSISGINRSDIGWDSQMICYPYIVRHMDTLYMFYNGNHFGRTGIGYATMEYKCL